MKYIIYKISLLSLLFTAFATFLYAVKAAPVIVNFTRPDGSVVPVRLYGDEFFNFKRDVSGFFVELGADGLLYYADYSSGSLALSKDKKVSYMPGNVLNGLRERQIARKMPAFPLRDPGLPQTLLKSAGNAPLPVRTPVLLVEFADVRFTLPDPVGGFTAQLNQPGYSLNGAEGSAAEYFNDNLPGKYTFFFDVFPVIIRLDKNKAYYGEDRMGGTDIRITELFEEACRAASGQGLDFSVYDSFGNGAVNNVAVIYAGTSQAETGISTDIWPQYNTLANLYYNGKNIKSFGCSAELSAYGVLKGKMAGIGTFCHEFSHSLGLPDLYDTNGENEGQGVALWESLSVMDGGNYLNSGRTPPYYTAIEREMLEYPVEIPVPGNTYVMPPVYKGGGVYRINSDTEGEYFLIECRTPYKWDKYIGGEGMIVYRVDKSGQVYGGIASYLRWSYNNINCFAQHQCATVFPAVNSIGTGLAHLFFPGSSASRELSSYGNNRFLDWNGKPLGINISGITYGEGHVRFDAVTGQAYDGSLPYPVSCQVVAYQQDCRIDWSVPGGVQAPEGKWRIEWTRPPGTEGDDRGGEIFTENTYCYISGLSPGKEYAVSVVFEQGSLYGRKVNLTCTTRAVTSAMPYIPLKGVYRVGERMDLRILNLPGEYEATQWYLDGQEQSGTACIFAAAGIFTVKAVIRYKDGSTEIISKRIKVE